MPDEPGSEPISDDELIYRRIPVSMGWYDDQGLTSEAFDPREDETTGISVFRAKYKTLENAGQGRSKQGYYVAVFRVGDLRNKGIEVVPRPYPDEPGHAELPDLTCNNRDEVEAVNRRDQLTALSQSVEGPFMTPPSDT